MTPSAYWPLDLIVLTPAVGALVNGLVGHRLPRRLVHWIACGAMAIAFFAALFSFRALVSIAPEHGGEGTALLYHRLYTWFASGGLEVQVAFLLDPLSAVMCLVVTGVGLLIHIYSIGYMHGDRSYSRFFAYLNFFCFAMLTLVLADSLPLLFVGWEGVGLASYLLIGFWYEDLEKARCGKKAFVVNRIGDASVLLAMGLLFTLTGTLDIPAIGAHLEGLEGAQREVILPFATLAGLLLFGGCAGKSAQIPLHVWLPDAMAGPTPVSALIHAATMVTAGVYLVARLSAVFALAPVAGAVVAVVGVTTAFVAATVGLVQTDIKRVLAYSTVSQLGYMFVGVGVGAYAAGIFHLITHAFFKALLFLAAGAVIHSLSGQQDIRHMGGLKKHLPVTRWTFLIACCAISGLPLFSGFFSKDEILFSALAGSVGAGWVQTLIWLVATVTAGMTALYMFRLYLLVFEGEHRGDEAQAHHIHAPGLAMAVPLMVLAVLSAVGGFLGVPEILWHGWHHLAGWLHPVVGEPTYRFAEHSLHAWEWFAMLVSLGVAVLGIGLAWVLYMRRPDLPARLVARVQRLHAFLSDAWRFDAAYARVLVEPLGRSARWLFRWVDRLLIDSLMVAGVAYVGRSAGEVVRRLQSGNVQTYAFFLVFGLCITLLWIGVG